MDYAQPDIIRSALLDIFKPKDRRPIHEWAHDHLVHLPPVLTQRGPFSVENSRHLIGPLDALQSDEVRQETVYKPVRGAGSLVGDVWCAWARANDPGPTLVIFQSDKLATDHASTRLLWTMKHCQAIKPLFSIDRFTVTKNQVTFADGLPIWISGPGLRNLQTRGVRYVYVSEAWIPAVGSMLEQIEARLGDFARVQLSKIFIESQAGTENDALDSRWCAGNAAEWNVECQSCGHYSPVKWSGQRADGSRWGMRWDEAGAKDKRGLWNVAKAIETVRWECEKCGHPHLDNTRTRANWNRSGRYVDTNPAAPPSLRSHRWNACILDPWQALLTKYLGAMNAYKLGNFQLLIDFFTKYMAEPRSESSVHETIASVPVAKYEVQTTWPEEKFRFMQVDVQETEFWIVVRAWGLLGESRRLYCGQKFNWTEVELLQKEHTIADEHVFIDSGYRTKEVYRKCCQHGAWARVGGVYVWLGWHPVKGEPQHAFPHKIKREIIWRSYDSPTTVDAESGTAHEGPSACQLIRFSDPTLQDRLEQLLKKGLMKSPNQEGEMEDVYRKHMASEFKRVRKSKTTGRSEWYYKAVGPNHLRDCEKIGVLAATLAGLLPDTIDADVPAA